MIVRMQKGSSFHGAQLYYLHDKRAKHELLRLSSDRLAWVQTRNCASNVPEVAFSEMIAVAQFQNELKLEAGHGLGGNKCDEPVLTVSLSWRPHVEKPTQEHMLESANEFMNAMGLGEHQAVILAHNDTAHQHVHLIINRINPRDGLVHDNGFDRNHAMRWREAYTREHGIIRDTDRAAEKHQHKHHDFAKDARAIQDRYEKLAALGAHGIEQAEIARRAQPDRVQLRQEPITPDRYAELAQTHQRTLVTNERSQLSGRHQQQREAFLATNRQQFKQARETAYREIRDAFASRWRYMYQEEQQLKQELKVLREDLSERAMHFARAHEFGEAWQTVHQPPEAIVERLNRLQEIYKERTELRAEQRESAREHQDEASKLIYAQRGDEFTALKLTQKQERAELKTLQAAREGGQPFDHQRLAELTNEAVPPQHTVEQQRPTQEAALAKDTDRPQEHAITPERADPAEKGPRRDVTDGIAGGIGKLAEIAADVLGALIAPETEQDRAGREAKARAQAAAAPEREAAAEAQILAQRQAAYERQVSAEEKIDAYFAKHADRISREALDEYAKKRDAKER